MNLDYTDEQKNIRQEIIDLCRAGSASSLDEIIRARELDALTASAALEAVGYACEDTQLAASARELLLEKFETGELREGWERVAQAAVAVGELQRLTERSIKNARLAGRSGDADGKSERSANRIADMKVRLEVSRLLVFRAASKLGRDGDGGTAAAIALLATAEDQAGEGDLRDAIARDLGL